MSSALEKLRKARQGSFPSPASANIGGGTPSNGPARTPVPTGALARLRAAQSQPTLTSAAQIYASDEEKKRQESEKNRGGALGGIGYVGEKLGLGLVQGVEGIFDFAIGGVADILTDLGVDSTYGVAEEQFANDWLNYNHADEWYNAGEGWKFAGDVSGGIGSFIPGVLAAAAVTYFTGGSGAGIAAALVTGTSAAGTATKEAYQETGELTGKEWGYGILSGATEAGIEYASAGIGAGAGAIGKRVGQAFGKTAAKEVGKTTVKSVAKELGKDFLSEAFEEGISEMVSPWYKRMTYDPSAKNATAGEIAYAALVGGVSGLVTSGGGVTVTQGVNIRRGAKAEASGSVGRIKAISEVVLEANEGKTDEQSINAVRELYHDITEGSLKITEGEKLSIAQKRALGELQQANMAAIFQPKMVQAASNAISNADAIVERLNSYGNIKMADGKFAVISDIDQYKADNPDVEVRDITAEDLRAGFDEKGGKQALTKAIQKNEVLRYVAASDVAGRLIMSVEQFEKTSLEGTTIKDQVALNKFIEEASPEKKRALGAELGIAEDEWDTLQLGRLNEAVRSYRESGKADAYKSRMEAVNKAKSVDESAAKKKIPSTIRLGDGKVERYKTDKVDIAVYRNGDSFVVYDYNENAPSRALSRAEVNSLLEQMRSGEGAAIDNGKLTVESENAIPSSARMSKETVDTSSTANAVPLPPLGKASGESSSEKTSKERVAEVKERIEAKKIDEYLRENVEDYDGLKEADRSMVRKVVREGRVHGLSEEDILSYARVAAHTGLNIEYDANMKDGDAGYYDPKANKIVVNPKAEKKQELILIHELDHAVRKLVDLGGNVHTLVYEGAEKGLSKETWEQIKADYAEQDVDVSREELLADEASAYYTEAILGGKITVDMLLGKNGPSGTPVPTMKKILDFFTGAARAYSKDEKLSRAARRHYKSFKAMFDAFAKANQGRNAETAVESTGDGKAAQRKSSDAITPKIKAGMSDEERYELLKDKKITAPFYEGEADALIAERKKALESKKIDFAKSAVVEIAGKLGIIKSEINFKDVEVKIAISNSNLRESVTKEATPEQIAKLLPILAHVAENSFVIERHNNRYYFDTDTVYFDNLLGAYIDGNELVPVRFGLKHSRTGTTTLYVVVDQNKVDVEKLGEIKSDRGLQDASPDLTGVNSLRRSVTYSISQIVPFVNSKDLLRYLPDMMLNKEQSNAKWEAVAETIKYTNNKNDKKYAEYIAKGDMRSAAQMVLAAAKDHGYTDRVYHGTKAFGFTEFDLEKTDDKRSLFAAGSTELAQTYSGKSGTKQLSEIKNIDSLSNDEVVKMLNAEAAQSYEGSEMQTEYETFTLKDVNKLISEVNDGIDELQKAIDVKVKEYADKMARDFDDTDAKTHSRLVEAKNLLEAYEYKRLSTPLYVLLHYTDAFRGDSNEKNVASLEYKIRLMNKLADADTADGVVAKKDLGGYGVSVLTFDKAREELKSLISSGNYALYGKPGKQLIVDANGRNWNDIKNWIKAAYHSTKDTYVKKDGGYYRLYDSDTDEQIFHGRIEINANNDKLSIDAIHPIMVQKANNVLAIRSENMRTTRDIAKFAKDEGYDSVKFENLVDNGGNGESVGASDVYVYFNPSDLKSADPVTYDDSGNVIPLSERFNPKNSDIRYAKDIKPELADEVVTETEENVGKSRFDKPDVRLKDKIKDTFTTTADKLYIDMIDELYGVEKYLKTRGKMKDANAFTQSVRAAETMAQTMIGVAQYDITDPSGKKLGDGLTKIFKKYKLRKIDTKFNTYLLHQLNVDRMTLEERSLAKQEELRKAFETAEAAYHRAKRDVDDGKRKTVPKDVWNAYRKAKSAYENYEVLKNKPVFGANEKRAADITAEESRKIIAEYEKRYPEFKETAEQVWAYSRNLQAMRVAAGLLSQESADIMAEYYPHYVPSFRDKNGGVGSGTVKNDSQLAVNSTVKKAVGGGEDIYDIEESLAVQTRQTIKAIKMNQLANAVYDSAGASGDTKYVLTAEAAEQINNTDADVDIDIELTPKNNQIVFYRDGKKVAMNVSEEIFKGFKGVTEGSVPDSALWQATSKALGGFKNLVTQYSPAFAARNFIRDMQDAFINTKHPGKFATHIKDALMGMANNDADWQTYLAYGGYASTVFDAKGFENDVDARGFEELKKLADISAKDFKSMAIPLQNLLKVIGNANSFIEQLTRFTEYKASIAAGDSIEVAINNSAEVTTNFSRHGSTVKKLNATLIPFLNASVQGFDKMLRVISGPFKEKSLTALAILLAKIVAIGITPQILNMIMNGDDEDYNDLTDEVKSNYFLIKVGDQFIKIPRGRLAGAFGGFANQIRNVSRGEGFDAAGYTESIVTNLTPVDSFSRDIFSPFRDVATNTTWYGGEIEGRQFDNVRPSQRYDESTSSIAIALGKVFNYSPKKIHYLLDQYSGVIGDFVLPATTKKAEKDYFSGNFLLDPKTNNKLSNDFYKLYDEAQYAKSEGNVTAIYQLKHLNDVKESVSELYDQITEIQRSDLSNTEKLQQVRVIRTLINNLYKTAKADYAAYTRAIEATAGMFDDSDASQQKLRHTVITQMMYGSEAALSQYNSAVYEKAALANKAGISYDLYYEYYFTTKGIESDYDKNGEVVAGSKKEKTLKAIKALKVSASERLLLTALSGYSLTEDEKRKLLSVINRMNGTKEEKAALAEKCGFKVKNGRISLK